MMSDSESDSGIERVDSGAPLEFNTVPLTQDFQLRICGSQCGKNGTKLVFPLKAGKTLPYSTTTITKKGKAFGISFSRSLTPSLYGHIGEKKGDWWIFTEECGEGSKEVDTVPGPSQSGMATAGRPRKVSSPPRSPRRSPSPTGTRSPSPRSPTPSVRPSTVISPTVHQNPNAIRDLKINFNAEVVARCSAKAREAAENDEYIEDDKEFVRVRNEIINSLNSRLKRIFGSAGKPGIEVMMEMVVLLRDEYANMFKECEAEDGKRKVASIKRQASLMCDRYREQLRREKRVEGKPQDEADGDEEEPTAKRKQKTIYGVVNSKWHKRMKITPQARLKLSQANDELDFERRESIFTNNRLELCVEFRSANGKKIGQICRSFFNDPRHLACQFEYITESPALNANIEKNLKTFMGHLEAYMTDMDKSVEFQKNLRDMELVCEMEMMGSTTLKDLHILRSASEHFDKGDVCQFIRMVEDSPADNSSPHLLAVLVDKTFIFELWTEQEKILGNMDIVTELASFFHLCFVFDLRYPKVGQTTADLIQRRVCRYGDDSGTRTWKRRDSAASKIEFFCSRVFKLMN